MENKYSPLLLKYGHLTLLMVLEHFEYTENYEECKLIDEALTIHQNKYNLDIPRVITVDVLQDYQAEFWRLGLSGETAMNNMFGYFETCMAEIK